MSTEKRGHDPQPRRAVVTAPAKPGAALALTLLASRLAEVEKVLESQRNVFDFDEEPRGYLLDHNSWCPVSPMNTFAGSCACGIATTLERLTEARAEVEAVRAELERIAREVQS